MVGTGMVRDSKVVKIGNGMGRDDAVIGVGVVRKFVRMRW